MTNKIKTILKRYIDHQYTKLSDVERGVAEEIFVSRLFISGCPSDRRGLVNYLAEVYEKRSIELHERI